MATKAITLRADDFRYPTKEERKKAKERHPELQHFDFKYQHELEAVLVNGKSLKEASSNNNLYWWNICLLNRLGKLSETYTYLFTSYDRSFPGTSNKYTQEEAVNRLQFDYYAEVFFYFFVSVRDTAGQIINIYYQLGKTEFGQRFDEKFFNKIEAIDPTIGKLLRSFDDATAKAIDLRNSFTHRFSPTESDYRTVCIEQDGTERLYQNESSKYNSKDFISIADE